MKILVIHGPNLNLLAKRETDIYGFKSLAQINDELKELADKLHCQLEIVQSNHEGVLLDTIHDALQKDINGILINPAAYGHTSIALRDALLAVKIPFVEVHLSNTQAREEFRHKTYLSDIALATIQGFGPESYLLGLQGLLNILRSNAKDAPASNLSCV